MAGPVQGGGALCAGLDLGGPASQRCTRLLRHDERDGGAGVPDRQCTADLEQLLAERGDHLVRTAALLTGNRQDGEDLLQAAVERLLRRGSRIDNPEGYLRRAMANLAADGWRRKGVWRRKLPVIAVGDPANDGDVTSAVDLRDALIRVLRLLPPQQRAVIVLRYWEQMSQSETAALLGCSEGTVKAAASRGLKRMRDLASPWLDTGIERLEQGS
jgi:RNA polymerase sigma-70 factor (sigma-E family)